MWFIGVEVEQDTSAPPPKKNPGSAPVYYAKYYENLGDEICLYTNKFSSC